MKQSAGGLDVADSSKSDDDIYLFEISYLKGKKATLLKQVIWPNYETTGWVFGCSSFSDAQTWVKAINKVSYRVSFWSILSGEDIHNPVCSVSYFAVLLSFVCTLIKFLLFVCSFINDATAALFLKSLKHYGDGSCSCRTIGNCNTDIFVIRRMCVRITIRSRHR
jgi:hypothetical protein